jgi:hypothetical protein
MPSSAAAKEDIRNGFEYFPRAHEPNATMAKPTAGMRLRPAIRIAKIGRIKPQKISE